MLLLKSHRFFSLTLYFCVGWRLKQKKLRVDLTDVDSLNIGGILCILKFQY
jgi:hypothetical protein